MGRDFDQRFAASGRVYRDTSNALVAGAAA
jgi:hypothetical protein